MSFLEDVGISNKATLSLTIAGIVETAVLTEVTTGAIAAALGTIHSGPTKNKAIFILEADGKRAEAAVNAIQCRLILGSPKRAELFAKRLMAILK
jgi:hypothetical protein